MRPGSRNAFRTPTATRRRCHQQRRRKHPDGGLPRSMRMGSKTNGRGKKPTNFHVTDAVAVRESRGGITETRSRRRVVSVFRTPNAGKNVVKTVWVQRHRRIDGEHGLTQDFFSIFASSSDTTLHDRRGA